MTVASLVVSIVAVLVALGALWYSRGQKIAAEAAAQAAEAAVELQRSAERRAAEAEERNRVVWELEPVGGSRHLLRNGGTESAYDVHVDRGELAVEGGGEGHFDEFPAGHKELYVLARTFGMKTTSVTVTWHQKPDRSDSRKRQDLTVVF